MDGRLVFKGRLVADGMWAVHALWGGWALASFAGGLWLCWASTVPESGPQEFRGAVALAGLIFLFLALVMFTLWRIATRAVVLRPDGLQFRAGLVRSVLVPYRDILSLGLSPVGTLVLEYGRDTPRGRMRRTLGLPRWVASHVGFREELRRRAPGAEVREAGLRAYSLRTLVGTLFGLWLGVAVAASPVLYVPSWKAKAPWLNPWLLGAGWLIGLVCILVYRGVSGSPEGSKDRDGGGVPER